MKLLFDQNISNRIIVLLPERYSGSTSVKDEGLTNASDHQIWEFAKNNGYIIVTQDSDFSNFNTLFGFPPKIIWIRTGNIRTQVIVDLLIFYETELVKFVESEDLGCFEILKFKK